MVTTWHLKCREKRTPKGTRLREGGRAQHPIRIHQDSKTRFLRLRATPRVLQTLLWVFSVLCSRFHVPRFQCPGAYRGSRCPGVPQSRSLVLGLVPDKLKKETLQCGRAEGELPHQRSRPLCHSRPCHVLGRATRAEQMIVFGGSDRTLCDSQITVPNHCIPHAPRHKIVGLQTLVLTMSAHNRQHRSRRSKHCTLEYQMMRKRAQTVSNRPLFVPKKIKRRQASLRTLWAHWTSETCPRHLRKSGVCCAILTLIPIEAKQTKFVDESDPRATRRRQGRDRMDNKVHNRPVGPHKHVLVHARFGLLQPSRRTRSSTPQRHSVRSKAPTSQCSHSL